MATTTDHNEAIYALAYQLVVARQGYLSTNKAIELACELLHAHGEHDTAHRIRARFHYKPIEA